MALTNYNIYLVNQSDKTENFWCFLQRPVELADDPNVYANSSASLAVAPNYPGTNQFTIPVQYIVGAGADNHAIGLDVKVISNVHQNASLGHVLEADYVTVPPQQGPTIVAGPGTSPSNTISILSNKFDKQKNEAANWYSNMSFGIQTGSGYIGMTWSPEPQKKRVLTPKLAFYVATGTYGENQLAAWDEFSTTAAQLEVPHDFSTTGDCTVTLDTSGDWSKALGKPSVMNDFTHLEALLSPQYMDLAAFAYLSKRVYDGQSQADRLVTVRWDSPALTEGSPATLVRGSVTVQAALVASFAYFVLSGVRFTVNGSTKGEKTFNFSYEGSQSAQHIKALFTAGVTLIFGGAK